MTPAEAWARVRVDPGNEAAWSVLRALPLTRAARNRLVVRFEQDARSATCLNLARRATAGTLPELPTDGQVVKYVATCVVNASLTLLGTWDKANTHLPAPAEPAVHDEPDLDPALLARLEDLYESALKVRQPHHRPHLELGWRQVVLLHTEPLTLDQVLVATEGVPVHDQPALDEAAARAYKRHERLREALFAALARRRRLLGEASFAELHEAIGLLRRRRPRGGQ